jgi:hypothetical protein
MPLTNNIIASSNITNGAITQLLNIFEQLANSAKDATSAQRVLTQQAQSQRVHTDQSNTFPQLDVPAQAGKSWMDLIENQPEFPPLEIDEQIPEPKIQSELLEYHNNLSTTTPPQLGTRANNTEFKSSLKIALITSWKQKQHQAHDKRQHGNTCYNSFASGQASAFLDNKTGDLLEYIHLLKNSKYKDVWSQSFSKEICPLATMTETILFLTKPGIPQAIH